MTDISILSDFDVFFFADENDLTIENESDILAGLLQPKRTLFYNRSDGCGISEKENYPNALTLNIGLGYDIVTWAGRRNTQVTDGSNNTPDRRIGVSQDTIQIVQSGGNTDINVGYIPFANIEKPGSVSVPLIKGT